MFKQIQRGLSALLLSLFSLAVCADDAPLSGPSYAPTPAPVAPNVRMIAGTQRDGELFVTGAREAVTSPTTIIAQVHADTAQFGPAGVASGLVRGTIKAGRNAFMGGARMLIGAMDILTMPLGRID